jgi:glycosyltransferase involved in cell wall biosynthesis
VKQPTQNILHLSNSDISGGAARAAYRLHVELCKLGCQSKMLVADKRSNDLSVEHYRPPSSLFDRLKHRRRIIAQRRTLQSYAATRPKGLELFSSDRSQFGSSVAAAMPSCDVVNLHWVAGFVDYQSFFTQVATRMPVVWTLHDMNPFTGGCHYDCGCSAYVKECGRCPQLGSASRRDLAHTIFHRKRRALSDPAIRKICIVSPSNWLAQSAANSALFRDLEIRVIPNGVDLSIFQPRGQLAAREVLGIPPDSKVILFVAHRLDNNRKGSDLLLSALDALSIPNGVFVITVGSGTFEYGKKFSHYHLGQIDSDPILSIIYSAADVFVIPSRQDNLPLTALEALACGTPVIGFRTGGVSEIVRPGITGLLAEPKNARDLRDCIAKLLVDSSLRNAMAVNCRQVAIEDYSINLQAIRYSDLYRDLMHSRFRQRNTIGI